MSQRRMRVSFGCLDTRNDVSCGHGRCDPGWRGSACHTPVQSLPIEIKDNYESDARNLYAMVVGGKIDDVCGEVGFSRALHFNQVMQCITLRHAQSNANLHCTHGVWPKRVTSGGVHLRDLAHGQHKPEETWLRWRHCVRFGLPGFEPQSSRTDSKQLS